MDAKATDLNYQPGTQRLNFLLVDDDDICVFIHGRMLELSGCCNSFQTAPNGKVALDIVGRAVAGEIPLPDVILLDLEMPVMNGLGFLENLVKMEPAGAVPIAIVLLTSSVSEADKAYARTLGAHCCLSKPLTPEDLEGIVKMVTEKENVMKITRKFDDH